MRGQQGSPRGTNTFGKAMYYEDRTVSPVRAAGMGLGGAAVAYGVPRMRLAQSALGVGTKADFMAGVARRATEPLGHLTARALVKSPEGQYLLRRLPSGARMGAVTLAGLALIGRSAPPTKARRRRVVGVPDEEGMR